MLKDLAKIVAVDAAAAGPCPSVSPLVQWETPSRAVYSITSSARASSVE